jgi:hypothetical protein
MTGGAHGGSLPVLSAQHGLFIHQRRPMHACQVSAGNRPVPHARTVLLPLAEAAADAVTKPCRRIIDIWQHGFQMTVLLSTRSPVLLHLCSVRRNGMLRDSIFQNDMDESTSAGNVLSTGE